MPRVSVLVPAYNVETYIGECLTSALGQTYDDMEVIAVDDGSTDRTASVIESYSDRIVFVKQPNKGPAAARNAALAVASGEYVALLDADDAWVPERLEIMVAYLDDHPEVSIVVSDAYLLDSASRPDKTYYTARSRRLRFRDIDQPYWIVQYNYLLGFVVCHRALFEKHGMFDESLRSFEDWELWQRFICGGARASLVSRPLGFYRRRAESITASPRSMIEDEIALLEKARAREASQGIPGLSGRLSLALAKRALAAGDTGAATEHLRASAADPAMPASIRLRARIASALPAGASRLYSRQLKTPPMD